MRVILHTSYAGPRCSYQPGEEADIYDTDARRLIERGLASPVRREEIETAIVTAPETTSRRARKPRKRKADVGQA
jgi:hypothetical protein